MTATRRQSQAEPDETFSEAKQPKVPRPSNAWILYRSEKFHDYKTAQEATQKLKMRQADLSRLIADKWHNEPLEVRERYEDLASKKKEEHMALHPDYHFAPRRLSGKAAKPSAASARTPKRAHDDETSDSFNDDKEDSEYKDKPRRGRGGTRARTRVPSVRKTQPAPQRVVAARVLKPGPFADVLATARAGPALAVSTTHWRSPLLAADAYVSDASISETGDLLFDSAVDSTTDSTSASLHTSSTPPVVDDCISPVLLYQAPAPAMESFGNFFDSYTPAAPGSYASNLSTWSGAQFAQFVNSDFV